MKKHYPAVFAGVGSEQIDVAFPDFPGCVTVAPDLDNAHARAADALALHVQSMAEDGDALPAGGDEDALVEMIRDYEEEGHRVLVASIPVEIPSGKAIRINVTLPQHVLSAADAWARTHKQTRSGLLATATLDYLARHR